MATKREPEDVNPSLVKASGVGTIFFSLITWVMFVGWLLSEEMGGLGQRGSSNYFNWHPLLMTATFLLFMTPGILSFEIYPCLRSTNKKLHGTMNTFAFISIIAGLIIILDLHLNLNDHGLLHSIHSIAGYMTFSLLCITYLVGLFLYFIGFGSDSLKKNAKPYHKRFGIFTLFGGYATILLGLAETISDTQIKLGQLMTGFVFLTMVGVIFSVTKFIDKNIDYHGYVTTENEDPDDQTDDDQIIVQS